MSKKGMETMQLAQAVAVRQHGLQYDKAGWPQVFHAQRVGMGVWVETQNYELAAAGFLHDVIEDTEFSYDDLLALDLSSGVRNVVLACTRMKDAAIRRVPTGLVQYSGSFETYKQFIQRISDHSRGATILKLVDIDDNLSRHWGDDHRPVLERCASAVTTLKSKWSVDHLADKLMRKIDRLVAISALVEKCGFDFDQVSALMKEV